MSESTAIIILAAGSSSRLGQSKQLLKFKNKTLLTLSIEKALSVSSKVIVVLGADPENHRKEIENLPIHIVENLSWEKGMGNSIKAGLHHLPKVADVDSIIIMVCDQPLLTGEHLKNLIIKFKEGSTKIVASKYQNTLGVPTLFSINLIPQLKKLEDHEGAKKFIQQENSDTVIIPLAGGEIDIDTPDDYEYLTKNY